MSCVLRPHLTLGNFVLTSFSLEHKVEPSQMVKWEWTTCLVPCRFLIVCHSRNINVENVNTAYHFDKHVRALSRIWLRTFVREFHLIGNLLSFQNLKDLCLYSKYHGNHEGLKLTMLPEKAYICDILMSKLVTSCTI